MAGQEELYLAVAAQGVPAILASRKSFSSKREDLSGTIGGAAESD